MNETLVFKERLVCGRLLYYPESESARTATELTKTTRGPKQAITRIDLQRLNSLGLKTQILKEKVIYE